MSAPALHVSGMLFLSRAKPQMTRTASGVPQLSLLAVHRIATHQTEPWRLVWTGPDAEAFYALRQADLTPGRPIHITANQLRSHTVGVFSEIVAHITHIEIHHDEPSL